MSLENIDIQCTIVSRMPASELLFDMQQRIKERNWLIEEIKFTDLDSKKLPEEETWPSETLGSMLYKKSELEEIEYSLFWSSYTKDGVTALTIGLYIKQYVTDTQNLTNTFDNILGDMMALFGADQCLCIVLSLEDTESSLAPSILGYYRPYLWGRLEIDFSGELAVNSISEEWIKVCPKTKDASLLEMSHTSGLQEVLTEIHNKFSALLWNKEKI